MARHPLGLALVSLLSVACSAEPGGAPVRDGDRPPGSMPPGKESPGGSPPGVFDPAPDPYEPAGPPSALPKSAIDAINTKIADILNQTNYTKSVRVENLTTGQVVANSTPERLLKPASNTKLFTTGTAIEGLGEDHPMALKAYGSAAIGPDGTLSGDLTVLSEHNFTASTAFYPTARTPFDRLARALHKRGLRRVTGATRLAGEIAYQAESLGTLDVGAHRARAAGPLGDALTAAGISHGDVATSATLTPPAGATLVAEYAPMPISVGSSPINVVSHNEFADILSRHLGARLNGESSYAGGGKAMIDWLRSLKIPTQGHAFLDGSGLSHSNRTSANAIVATLKAMANLPEGPAWKHTMAIGGVRGTIGSRLAEADTKGRVFGKTGTLRDTIALSGYLDNRHDGQTYVFSILQNAVDSQATARDIADDVVRVIAKNHRQSGARPPAPVLTRVRGGAAKGVVEIGWQPVAGIERYLVWLSEDGRVWQRDKARLVKSTRFVAGELPEVPNVFVRVTALDSTGLESDPSATLAASPTKDKPEVLLVDANERWLAQPQPENVLGQHHDFLVALARATGSRRIDSVRHVEVAEGKIDLTGYKAVVWAAGETSTVDKPFEPSEQSALSKYINANGAVLFSGAELLYALSRGSDADKAFAADVLHAGLGADSAETFEFEGADDTEFKAVPATSFLTPDAMRIDTPDVLTPTGGSVELLRYVGGAGGAAALGYSGTGRVVVTGFPVESIASGAARKAVLDAAFHYLGL